MPGDPAHPPPPALAVFFGPDGLRAGWALALGYLLLQIADDLRHRLLTSFLPPGRFARESGHTLITLRATLHDDLSYLLMLLALAWLLARLERRPVTAYGLGGRHRLPNLLLGAASGALLLSLLAAILLLTHHLAIDARLLFGPAAILRSALAWLATFLVVACTEEFLLRGFVQFTLARGLTGALRSAGTPHAESLGFWTAATLLSLLFGLLHTQNAGESPLGIVIATAAGLVFSLALRRTGSLWWAIGFHATWDWAQSFLFGVADSGTLAAGRLLATHPLGSPLLSGGATGPEGSLFALPVLALAAAIVLLTLQQAEPLDSAQRTPYPFEDPSPSIPEDHIA